jgi:hypothetical protein
MIHCKALLKFSSGGINIKNPHVDKYASDLRDQNSFIDYSKYDGFWINPP